MDETIFVRLKLLLGFALEVCFSIVRKKYQRTTKVTVCKDSVYIEAWTIFSQHTTLFTFKCKDKTKHGINNNNIILLKG